MAKGRKRFRDFDAFWKEQQKEPVVLQVFGEEHELPAGLPAPLFLRAAKLMEDNSEASIMDVWNLATDLFGKDRMERWSEKGLQMDQVLDLMRWTIGEYMGIEIAAPGQKADEDAEDDADEGNEKAAG